MSSQLATIGNFHADLKAILPRLRIYALSLTRDFNRSDVPLRRPPMKHISYIAGAAALAVALAGCGDPYYPRYGNSQSYYSPSGYNYYSAPASYSYPSAYSYNSRSDYYRSYNGIHSPEERAFP
jgi:hypothetical protein